MKGRPTPLELKVLHVLWDLGNTATVNEVIASWPEKAPPGYTTVLKVLQNMDEKGFVAHERSGRSYRYTALLPKEQLSRGRLQELLHSFYKGDKMRLVNALVEEVELSAQEIREMRKLLDEKAKEKRG
jgi:predicted transcriptional regulator